MHSHQRPTLEILSILVSAWTGLRFALLPSLFNAQIFARMRIWPGRYWISAFILSAAFCAFTLGIKYRPLRAFSSVLNAILMLYFCELVWLAGPLGAGSSPSLIMGYIAIFAGIGFYSMYRLVWEVAVEYHSTLRRWFCTSMDRLGMGQAHVSGR